MTTLDDATLGLAIFVCADHNACGERNARKTSQDRGHVGATNGKRRAPLASQCAH